MEGFELNLDGLVGPSHHYAGLSPGNLASSRHARHVANPKAAALQGLAKMRLMLNLGLKQAILPPQQRPNLNLLRACGFSGDDAQVLQKAHQQDSSLLSAAYSASCMWAANAATVTPSQDSADQKLHFTAANLVSNLHRHQEAPFTARILKTMFADPQYFSHHPVLPYSSVMGDEGAANHSRICRRHAEKGLHLYVYGQTGLRQKEQDIPAPQRYPARQSRLASECIARSHGLQAMQTVFACQNPQAIDAGVFHNDVIAVANENVILIHEDALCQQAEVLDALKENADFDLQIITVSRDALSVEEAVATYLFNAQLLSLSNGRMAYIAPGECETHPRAKAVIQSLLDDTRNPVSQVHFLDLKQSMQNGGGPACLRLRVPLNSEEMQHMHQGVILDADKLQLLEAFVQKHYRDRLAADDLRDVEFMKENLYALEDLSQLLGLGHIYPFQQ